MLDIYTMSFRSIAELFALVVSGNDSKIPGNQLVDFVGQIRGVHFVFCYLAILASIGTNRYRDIS